MTDPLPPKLAGRREMLVVLAVVAGLALFYMLTIRPGHHWGGDFAMYLAHARNLAEGQPYGDTGYVLNPNAPRVGPRNYPPIYPLLLSVPYRIFGGDLELLKRFTLFFLVGFWAVFYAVARRHLTAPYSLFLLVAIGLNPFFWSLRDSVIAEFPFLMFLFLSIYLFQRLDHDAPSRRRWILALATGAVGYLAYGTRSLGILLFPALVGHDLLRLRRLRLTTLVACAGFLLAMLLQAFLLGTLLDYGSMVVKEMSGSSLLDTLRNQVFNIVWFPVVLSRGWRGALPGWVELPIAAGLYCLAAWGAFAALRGRAVLLPVFAATYLGAMAILPWGGDLRRLLPAFPILLFCVAFGLQELSLSPASRRGVTAAMVAVLAVSYLSLYSHGTREIEWEGIHDDASVELFTFVREQTQPDSLLIFFKPRVLAYYTGRHASDYNKTDDPSELLGYFRSIGATHLVVKRELAEPALPVFVNAYRKLLQPVFRNADFTVYELLSDRKIIGALPSAVPLSRHSGFLFRDLIFQSTRSYIDSRVAPQIETNSGAVEVLV